MRFASPLASRFARPLAFIGCGALTAAAIAAGCGGGSETTGSTGTFGGGGAQSSGSGQTINGSGGTIFNPTVGSSGVGGSESTSSGMSSSGSMPICDGNPTMGTPQWAQKNADDTNAQNALAVTVDPAGNVIVTGSYSGKLTLGGKTAEVMNASNALFVAKFSADGAAQWVHGYAATTFSGLHTSPHAAGQGVVVDALGDVYVVGNIYGAMNFGGGVSFQSAGGQFGDVFLLKIDSSGNTLAGKRIGDPAGTQICCDFDHTARGIALLKSTSGDRVAIIGQGQNVIDVGDGKTVQGGGKNVGFVAVYAASTLTAQFVSAFGDGTVEQAAYGVAYDKNKDLLVAGNTAGLITFPGGVTATPAGAQGAFVAKIKGDGSGTTWAKVFGSSTAGAVGVATDPTGDVFITGNHKGDIDFGGGVLANPNGDNVFVARLDNAGAHVWSKTFGDSKAQQPRGIAVDAGGRPIVVGDYTGKIDFGNGALTANNQDAFIAKLDTHGCEVWSKSLGDASVQSAAGVAVDTSGNAVFTGLLFGSITLGATTLTAGAGEAAGDMFVAKVGP